MPDNLDQRPAIVAVVPLAHCVQRANRDVAVETARDEGVMELTIGVQRKNGINPYDVDRSSEIRKLRRLMALSTLAACSSPIDSSDCGTDVGQNAGYMLLKKR